MAIESDVRIAAIPRGLVVIGARSASFEPTIRADELGPVIPRTFPPAPAWSPDGHRIKAELDYSRGPQAAGEGTTGHLDNCVGRRNYPSMPVDHAPAPRNSKIPDCEDGAAPLEGLTRFPD